MIEIIALTILTGAIGDMARRRGRSATLFGLLLIGYWLVGEAAGTYLGLVLSKKMPAGQPNLLIIYASALTGAVVGAGIAFLIARSVGPEGGVWRELADVPISRSRFWGAVVGGVGGGLVGAGVMVFVYHTPIAMALQGFLAVGLVGALLGMVSGIQGD